MKKGFFKKSIGFFLAVIMVFSVIPFTGMKADAATTNNIITSVDAVNWCRGKLGYGLDWDGVNGCQCVDFVAYYLNYLGNTGLIGGNACDYAYKTVPEGWSKIAYYDGFVPMPGDIAVWTYSSGKYAAYGHVAVVVSADANQMTVIHQNWSGQYVTENSIRYSHGNFYGVLRPWFNAHVHTYTSTLTVKPTSTTNGIRTYGCYCGDSYTETVTIDDYTSENAVNWCKEQLGYEREWDGVYEFQCVDFLAYYLYYLGNTELIGGNACDYAYKTVPKGWSKIAYYDGFVPMPGDIAVWTYSSGEYAAYGHVAVVVSADANQMTVIHQNWSGQYVTENSIRYSYGNFYGVLRPDFNVHVHTYKPTVTVNATCTADGIRTYICECGDSYTESIPALGHDYHASCAEKPNCEHGIIVKYTCAVCGNEYTKNEGTTNVWLTEPIEGITPSKTKTQYRKSVKETKTSSEPTMSGYEVESSKWVKEGTGSVTYVSSFPSGFDTSSDAYKLYNKSAPTASETSLKKRVLGTTTTEGYLYWHWICDAHINAGKSYSNRYYGNSKEDYLSSYGQYPTHFEYNVTTTPMTYWGTGYGFKDTTVDLPQDSKNYNYYVYWWLGNGNENVNANIEIKKTEYTDYVKQFTYAKWSDWSDWQDTSIAAGSNVKVETRTLYRYDLEASHVPVVDPAVKATCEKSGLTEGSHCSVCGTVIKAQTVVPAKGHSWNSGVVTKAATTSATGVKTYTCTVCGKTKTETIPKLPQTGDTLNVGIDTASAQSGKEFTVKFDYEGVDGLYSFGIWFTFDKNVFEFVGGKCLSPDYGVFDASEDDGLIAAFDTPAALGKVAEATFRVKDGVKDGDYTIAYEFTAEDSARNKHEYAADGKVTVASYIRGDVDGSGAVNSADALYLLRNTMRASKYPINQSGDMNGDGSANSADALYLLRHTMRPSKYPLF